MENSRSASTISDDQTRGRTEAETVANESTKAMSILEMALRLGGVPQSTIDEIEKASPAAADLVKMVKNNQVLIGKIAAFAAEAKPTLDKAAALYIEASPLINQVTPLVNQAWIDVKDILPAAQDILALLKAQQAQSDQPAPGSQF